MTEPVPIRSADTVVTWKTYVAALDEVCSGLDIPVPRGAEIQAELADRTAIRIVVKTSD